MRTVQNYILTGVSWVEERLEGCVCALQDQPGSGANSFQRCSVKQRSLEIRKWENLGGCGSFSQKHPPSTADSEGPGFDFTQKSGSLLHRVHHVTKNRELSLE